MVPTRVFHSNFGFPKRLSIETGFVHCNGFRRDQARMMCWIDILYSNCSKYILREFGGNFEGQHKILNSRVLDVLESSCNNTL